MTPLFPGATIAVLAEQAPVEMVLHCPCCGTQHIDAADEARGWHNPPHRSHLCAFCKHVWRPADICTTGVAAVQTRGQHDDPVETPPAVFPIEAPLPWTGDGEGRLVDATGRVIGKLAVGDGIDAADDEADSAELARAVASVINRAARLGLPRYAALDRPTPVDGTPRR